MTNIRLLSLTLLLLSPYAALAAERGAARLSQLSGQVEIKPQGRTVWEIAKPGQDISPGTQIKTGKASSVRIKTSQNHQLRLSPTTTIEVKQLTKEKTSIQVLIGRMRSVVKKLKERASYEVRTPVAVASVRGTDFDTIVEDENKSAFEVYDGVVGVKDIEELGDEISVFKNHRTIIERGAAPTPPEKFDREMRGMLNRSEQTRQGQLAQAKEEQMKVRHEIQREVAHERFKEFLQADVAHEQRRSEYQDGKTVIDAFGLRVRVEEYFVRPNPNQISFVTINTRENNVAFSRFDAFAANPLPSRIVDIDPLFGRSGDGSETIANWITRTKWFISNGGDLYREWQEGGDMVYFSDIGFWQVVFDHWFVEIKGAAESNFNLLSHWKPANDFASGANAYSALNLLDPDGANDLPLGYEYFDNGTTAGIGNDRPIDAVGFNGRRLDSDIFNSTPYQNSEGYTRTSHAEFDGVSIDIDNDPVAALNAILTAHQSSAVHMFTDASMNVVTSLRVDQYHVRDDGKTLSLLELPSNFTDTVNFEYVVTSPDYVNRIDLILSPRIFSQAGLIE